MHLYTIAHCMQGKGLVQAVVEFSGDLGKLRDINSWDGGSGMIILNW